MAALHIRYGRDREVHSLIIMSLANKSKSAYIQPQRKRTSPSESLSSDTDDQCSNERILMREWLLERLRNEDVPGVTWKNKDEQTFQVPWKHAARQGWQIKKDALIFQRWAEHTGKISGSPNPKRWKANFRCAINSLPDVEELKEESLNKGHNAFKVYRFLPGKKIKKHHKLAGHRIGSRSKIVRKHGLDQSYSPQREQSVDYDSNIINDGIVPVSEMGDSPRSLSSCSPHYYSQSSPDYFSPSSIQSQHSDTSMDSDGSSVKEEQDDSGLGGSPVSLQDHSYSNTLCNMDVDNEEVVSTDIRQVNLNNGGRVQVVRRSSTSSLPYCHSPGSTWSGSASPSSSLCTSPVQGSPSDLSDEAHVAEMILQMETGSPTELNVSFFNYEDSGMPTTLSSAMAAIFDIPTPDLRIHIPK